jgi:UDP-N-acetyl-2-amino-2-deoxyglucuronate dehydrogenase
VYEEVEILAWGRAVSRPEVRFGLIGTGTIAEFHARAMASVEKVRLVAVTSRREGPGREFAQSHGCVYEPSIESLLARDDIDAVAITTPSGHHAEVGIAAARAGKHVFCEKPIDVALDQVDALNQTCREHGVQLGAVFQSRMGDSGRFLKEAVESGRFGKLSQCSAYIPWFRSPEYYAGSDWRGTWELDGGGALMNQGIHAVDMLLWIAGEVVEVSARCQTRFHEIEVEDNAVAWLKFASGAIGVVQASTCLFPGQPKRIEVMGEKGSVVMVDDTFTEWSFVDERPEDEQHRRPLKHSGIGGGISDPKAISIEGHRRLYEDFADAILSGRPSGITGEEARRAVELILAIYRSSREGRTIRLRQG